MSEQAAAATESTQAAESTGSIVAEAAQPAQQVTETPAQPVEPKEGEKEAPKEGEKPEATPAEYKDFTIPEGVEVDEKVLTDFRTTAQEAGLSQEQAQKFVDLYSGQLKEVAEAPYKSWTEQQQKWQDEVKNDPEIGGKNFEPMKASIAKAIDELGGKEADTIREAFNFTGAGNNPAIIRFLYRLSNTINEGGPVSGGKPAAGPKSAAQVLYPTQP